MKSNKRGGSRTGAGRKPGSQTRATREQKATLSELAKAHTKEAIATLVSVMKKGESDTSRVAAANSILDRAYGRPAQSVAHSGAIGSYDLTKVTDENLAKLEAILGSIADAGGDQGGAE